MMSSGKELYFIALIPQQSLAEKIHLIKTEIAEKYNSKHSLKVPEHITLIPPFRCNEAEIPKIISTISEFAKIISAFEVVLKNFGHFGQKIIFIDAHSRPPEALSILYYSMKELFEKNFSFAECLELKDEFHSHLTIANRDLKSSNFKEAWSDFKERKFEESFHVKSLFILNHPNNIWTPFQEISFGN